MTEMLSVINEWISTEHWWNDSDRVKQNVLYEESESLDNDSSSTAIFLSTYLQIWA